jgi:hypothetical protein
MNPGRLSLSAPSPYSSHEPMLGRPLMAVPAFMKAWAGSWLICSVCMERTMHRSSAMPPMNGKERGDFLAGFSPALEFAGGRQRLERRALQLRQLLAFGERFGKGLAVDFFQRRFVVQTFQVRRAAGHAQMNDAPGARREMRRIDHAPPFWLRGRRRDGAAGLSRQASARPPRP